MNVRPLRALCVNCGAEELLSRIANGDGSCPFCQLRFSEDDTLRFQQEAYRAHVAYRLLIRSLQNLGGSPPSIRVLPEPLYEGLAEVLPSPVRD